MCNLSHGEQGGRSRRSRLEAMALTATAAVTANTNTDNCISAGGTGVDGG